MLNAITSHSDLILAISAALSAFSASLLVAWPYLIPNTLELRMHQLADEREAIRARERSNLQISQAFSLRTEPNKLFKQIFERLNLAKHAEENETVQRLRLAGYRGRGPVVTFLALRAIVPLVMFLAALFYIFIVLQLQYPLMFKLSGALSAALLGYYLPGLYVRNRITKRQAAIRRAWPDALDLLLICVESGMAMESAFHRVGEEFGPQCQELADELGILTAELSYLADRRKAYENLGNRIGLDGVKAVTTSLIQAEKYGTPVAQALRVMAQENRQMRMSEAEKKAAALPPKLTVPMILFFLPVLFVVIITPAAIQIMNIM